MAGGDGLEGLVAGADADLADRSVELQRVLPDVESDYGVQHDSVPAPMRTAVPVRCYRCVCAF